MPFGGSKRVLDMDIVLSVFERLGLFVASLFCLFGICIIWSSISMDSEVGL